MESCSARCDEWTIIGLYLWIYGQMVLHSSTMLPREWSSVYTPATDSFTCLASLLSFWASNMYPWHLSKLTWSIGPLEAIYTNEGVIFIDRLLFYILHVSFFKFDFITHSNLIAIFIVDFIEFKEIIFTWPYVV